jgi:uncharacterized integral membrane protein (TIGR00697 family)
MVQENWIGIQIVSNELLFFLHIALIGAITLYTARLSPFALTAWIALQSILANLFVLKQIELFGLTVTCSDGFAIGSILALNVLQEFWGRQEAIKAIQATFFSMLFFVLMSQIHLAYVPSSSDATQLSFQTLFSSTPRIIVASMLVTWMVQRLDLSLFNWLRKWWGSGKLPLRFTISLCLSQTLDTVLFSYLGLYGIVSSMAGIICMSLFVKWIAIGVTAPFTSFAKRWMRRA